MSTEKPLAEEVLNVGPSLEWRSRWFQNYNGWMRSSFTYTSAGMEDVKYRLAVVNQHIVTMERLENELEMEFFQMLNDVATDSLDLTQKGQAMFRFNEQVKRNRSASDEFRVERQQLLAKACELSH